MLRRKHAAPPAARSYTFDLYFLPVLSEKFRRTAEPAHMCVEKYPGYQDCSDQQDRCSLKGTEQYGVPGTGYTGMLNPTNSLLVQTCAQRSSGGRSKERFDTARDLEMSLVVCCPQCQHHSTRAALSSQPQQLTSTVELVQ
eukprot:1986390-Rhodomonas_salina.1